MFRTSVRYVQSVLARPSIRRKLPVAVVGIVGLYLFFSHAFSVRDVVILIGVLISSAIIFNGEEGIQYGFILWVLTLALGYRTIGITRELQIHPSEVLLWLLFACVCIHRRLGKSEFILPIWLWLLIPFWVLAWWPLIMGAMPWDRMLNEFRNFVLLLPLMIVATVVLQRGQNWQRLLMALFIAGTWIGLLGIVEFWFRGFSSIFPSFMTAPSAGVIENFERANFSFWGGPMATFICALALPIGIVAVRWWPAQWQRALIAAAAGVQVIAIYIGGYRSIWFVLVAQILITCLLTLKRNRVTIAAICLVVMIGGYQFLPQAGTQRALSGIEALRGRPIDSSSRDRIGRAESALKQMISAPLGSGWSSAGWVHSDFVQVGANLGLLGGLIFLGGYLYTLARLARRVLFEAHDDLGFTLLLSHITVGGILATQGVEVLPQLVLPVWFVWILVEVWLRQPAFAYNAFAVHNQSKQFNLDYSPV